MAVILRVLTLKDPCVAAQTYTANIDDGHAMYREITADEGRERGQKDVLGVPSGVFERRPAAGGSSQVDAYRACQGEAAIEDLQTSSQERRLGRQALRLKP